MLNILIIYVVHKEKKNWQARRKQYVMNILKVLCPLIHFPQSLKCINSVKILQEWYLPLS